jgi:hypothetical protein
MHLAALVNYLEAILVAKCPVTASPEGCLCGGLVKAYSFGLDSVAVTTEALRFTTVHMACGKVRQGCLMRPVSDFHLNVHCYTWQV